MILKMLLREGPEPDYLPATEHEAYPGGKHSDSAI